MIYRQKSKKRSKRPVVVLVGIILFVAIASLLLIKAHTPLSRVMRIIGLPLWKAEIFLSNHTHSVSGFFRSRNDVIAENDALRAEHDLDQQKLLDYEVLKSEHAKILQDYGRDGTQNKILATVLVRPPQTPYDTLIIDIGSNNGIVSDDVVYTTGGIILGTVSEVSARTSNVTLFSRTNLMTPAIFERTNLAVTVRGIGGGTFEAQVPQEADIVKDDIVILPKLEPSPLGAVELVESSVKSAFKRVLIQTPINISYTRFVLVGQKN